MKNLLLILPLIVTLAACSKDKIDKDASKCVNNKIRSFAKENDCADAAADKYRFQGKVVYVLTPCNRAVDGTSEVIDEDCKTIGHLGGIAGNWAINGERFTNAVHLETVWKK